MKFKNKKGVIVETHNLFEEKILRENPNYTEVKEKVEDIEEKPQKPTKKGGNKPS
jgi:hypothetical protein